MENEPLSQYELDRLANIEKNQAELVRLGLVAVDSTPLDLLCVRTKRPKKQRVNSSQQSSQEPSRRSNRQSNAPVQFMEISYEESVKEDRDAELAEKISAQLSGRPQRDKRRPMTFEQEQAGDILKAQEALLRKKIAKTSATAHEAIMQATHITEALKQSLPYTLPQPSAPKYPPIPRSTTVSSPATGGFFTSGFVVQPTAPSNPRYFTQGAVSECPVCKGYFVVKKDGTMRKHDCAPCPSQHIGASAAPVSSLLSLTS